MSNREKVVLYDGVCNLCDAAVQFTIVRDRKGAIRYAALQSETGQRMLTEYGMKADALDTFVFVENGRAYVKSSAALRLLRQLSGGWPLLSVFLLLPRWMRDPLYSFIAKNRYRWFGKKEQCMLMKPEYRKRFLP